MEAAGFLEQDTKERLMRYMVSLDKSRIWDDALQGLLWPCWCPVGPILGFGTNFLNSSLIVRAVVD